MTLAFFSALLAVTGGTQDAWHSASAHEGEVLSVAFSPVERRLATGGTDGKVKLWSTPKLDPLATLDAGKTGVSSLAYSPDGKVLAAANGDPKIHLWDGASSQEREGLSSGAGDSFSFVAISRDGKTLAAGDGLVGKVVLFSLDASAKPRTIEFGGGAVTCLRFAPKDAVLIIGQGKSLRLWDLAAQKEKGVIENPAVDGERRELNAVTLSFSADSQLLAVPGQASGLLIFKTETGAAVERAGSENTRYGGSAWSKDGKFLFTGDLNGTIRRWPLGNQKGPPVGIYPGKAAVTCLEISPVSGNLVGGFKNGKIWLIE